MRDSKKSQRSDAIWEFIFLVWGGAKPIKDATATPADVATGKVFYNNEGRHVGEANDVFKNKTYAVKIGTSITGRVNCLTIVANNKGFLNSVSPYSRDYNSEIYIDYKRINTVNVGGITYKIYQDKRILGLNYSRLCRESGCKPHSYCI